MESNRFLHILRDTRVVSVLTIILGLFYIPAFVYGVASLWVVAYLFLFMHLGRSLCQSSLRRYEERLSYTNESPKIKGIVIGLCAYLSLPFLAYIFIIGDLNAPVQSGLDRAVVMILPLEAIKLPIDGDPSVFQMLLVFQLLLSFFGFGGGMLFARKEITAMSLPSIPKNIPVRDDMTDKEWKQRSDLWFKYDVLSRLVLGLPIFGLVFVTLFFRRFWVDGDIHVLEYVFILPSIFLMPFALFFHFFAAAVVYLTAVRSEC